MTTHEREPTSSVWVRATNYHTLLTQRFRVVPAELPSQVRLGIQATYVLVMGFEKATLIGTSSESFTDATDDAIDRAMERYDGIKWAETEMRGVEIARAEDREYQVEVTVAYDV